MLPSEFTEVYVPVFHEGDQQDSFAFISIPFFSLCNWPTKSDAALAQPCKD